MAAQTITLEFNKNDIYVLPPVVLGDGHMIEAKLQVPGKITSVDPYKCEGLGCGWTHFVKVQPLTDTVWSWIGWSNSGQNCKLYITVHFEGVPPK